jgi:hypothetical protein
MTVLLSFDPTSVERYAARALAANFVAAECSFAQSAPAAELGDWIEETLHRQPPSCTCIVVALPNHSPQVEQELRIAIDAIRRGHHEVALIVGVATATLDWAGCDLDGFVVVPPNRRGTDALRVFFALAAIMAPGLIPCLDADDFRCALGSAANPSRLAEAAYLPDSDCLLPVDRTDQRTLSDAIGIAVMPAVHLRLATLALLVKAVRAQVAPEAALTLVSPSGLTLEPFAAGASVGLLLLYRIGARQASR